MRRAKPRFITVACGEHVVALSVLLLENMWPGQIVTCPSCGEYTLGTARSILDAEKRQRMKGRRI